MIGYID